MATKPVVTILSGIYIAVFCFSCKNPENPRHIADFARLECRAVILKNERFALADSIRRLEDNNNPSDSLSIKNMYERAGSLKQSSLTTADSIKNLMAFLFQQVYKTEKERQSFLEEVKKVMPCH